MHWLDEIHDGRVGNIWDKINNNLSKINRYNPLANATADLYNASTAKNKAAATPVIADPKAQTQGSMYEQIRYLQKDMFAAGFPRSYATSFATAVIMLESDWMRSNLARNYNNYAGIKFVGQKYAKQGPKAPDGGYYAAYGSFLDFCRDFLRVLSLNTGKQGRPIDADNATAFMGRMKANKYFTDPNYVTKWNAAYKKVYEAVAFGKNQEQKFIQDRNDGRETFTIDPEKGIVDNAPFNADRKKTQIMHWVEDHPIIAGALGLGAFIFIVKVVERR